MHTALWTALALAGEGMWMPEQLPELAGTLAEMGLELPAEQLADPTLAPLGAVVSLGGCSASFLSSDGLLGTNHHCVTRYLGYNSSAEADRERDGFLAASRSDELSAGPTARVTIVEQIADVTEAIAAAAGKRTRDAERHDRVERAKKELVATCEEQPGRRCAVVSFYEGTAYRLVTQLELKDLRIVYAPHSRVGSYGGELDNWQWPRHAGDFAFLRAYVGPDGAPAIYSPDNVPYRPPHHLELDTSGVQPGDFVMVAGFPGHTFRHRTVHEIAFERDVAYPHGIQVSDDSLAIFEAEAERDPEARARLGALIGMVSNGRTYRQGMLDGFTTSGVVERKQAQWDELQAWVQADSKRRRRYGKALDELVALIEERQAGYRRDQLVRSLQWLRLLGVTSRAYRLAQERAKPDLERDTGYQDRDLEGIRQSFERLEKTLWLPSDRKQARYLFEQLAALPPDQHVGSLDRFVAERGGIEATVEELYGAVELVDTDARLALLEMDRATFEASDDPWIRLALAREEHLGPLRERNEQRQGAMLRLRPLYMEALLASSSGPVYPDANSTLRITVGHVEGYAPRDGVLYLPQTTRAGMVAKAGAEPYDAPERMLSTGPGTRWVDEALGDVPVDFLTTLDTTGGNSGSATLNARGELVGFIFDGNYEAMPADWLFDPELTRSIHVDIRYVLWILDAVEGASWILDELGIEE